MTVTNVKLQWILTQYGKNRINELLTNPDDKIRISTMHIGDDGTGTPQERETEDGTGRLKHEVAVGIPIVEKGLDPNRENTVYFVANINENMSGYDVAELAIYEERNGVEKMFAVGVGQAIPKPKKEYGYLITVEYKLFIESTNLLAVYDQIVLDPDNEYLKQTDIDSLYRTVLYVEGNMAEQIGKSTHQIGLGRAKELNDLISDTRLKYNAASISSYYSSMANSIDELKNILGFWSFHYTNNYGIKMNIKDFSSWDNYFSTNALLSSYEQEYLGVLSSLNFTEDDFFYADIVPAATSSVATVKLGHLIDHTLTGHMTFSPDSKLWLYNGAYYTEDQVKNNFIRYYLKANVPYTTSSTITLGEIGTDCFGPLTWVYTDTSAQGEESGKWTCNELNTTYDISTFKAKIISYTNIAEQDDQIKVYLKGTSAVTSSEVIELGTTLDTCPAPSHWTYNLSQDRWIWTSGDLTVSYTSQQFKETVLPYTGTPENNATIDIIGDSSSQIVQITFTGKQLDLINYVTNASTGVTTVKDSPFTFIASLQHNATGERNTLLAQSSYFTNKHNFEIAKTELNAIEVTLYSELASKYIKFTTNNHAVPTSAYNIVITYNPNYNALGTTLNPDCKIYINNQMCTVTKTESGTYTGMKENLMQTTSYVDNVNKVKEYPINAKVCLMALIKEEFGVQVARCNSLILNSLAGKNVYYKV